MINTKYAPAGRVSQREIERQASIFSENGVLELFLGRIPAIFLVINQQRQIVYMNKGALDFTGLHEVSDAIGKRPGELMDCIHAQEELDGCGTSEECTYCGAVNAILDAQKNGEIAVRDARLLLGNDHSAFDLRIYAAPLQIDEDTFTAITIEDIRHEKWHTFLERIFFHDILNTASGLVGTIELARKYKGKVNTDELLARADDMVQNLIEEIKSQQLLTAAEAKILSLNLRSCRTKDVIEEIQKLYSSMEIANDKTVQLDAGAEDIEMVTDITLLKRILGNMVKNALEAVQEQDTVTIGCNLVDDRVQFTVHNPGFIPRNIQLQIFKRSFSTKGKDRGLGTYSMKLLGSFLNASVSFTTSKENGTLFILDCPIEVPEKDSEVT